MGTKRTQSVLQGHEAFLTFSHHLDLHQHINTRIRACELELLVQRFPMPGGWVLRLETIPRQAISWPFFDSK